MAWGEDWTEQASSLQSCPALRRVGLKPQHSGQLRSSGVAPLSCLASRITAPGFGENLDNASPRRTAPNEAEVSVHPRGVGTRGQHLPWGQSWPRGCWWWGKQSRRYTQICPVQLLNSSEEENSGFLLILPGQSLLELPWAAVSCGSAGAAAPPRMLS